MSKVKNDLDFQTADIAIAPLTITYDRQQYVDFTKPFMDLGLIILISEETEQSQVLAFLQPFQWTLWVSVAGAFLATAMITTLFR